MNNPGITNGIVRFRFWSSKPLSVNAASGRSNIIAIRWEKVS